MARLTHKSSRIGDIGADLAVNLDEPLHADFLHLIPSQGILEAVPQENNEGQALPQFVRTGGRTRSLTETTFREATLKPTLTLRGNATYEHSGELVKHPVLWRRDALQVLLRSSGLDGVDNMIAFRMNM